MAQTQSNALKCPQIAGHDKLLAAPTATHRLHTSSRAQGTGYCIQQAARGAETSRRHAGKNPSTSSIPVTTGPSPACACKVRGVRHCSACAGGARRCSACAGEARLLLARGCSRAGLRPMPAWLQGMGEQCQTPTFVFGFSTERERFGVD